MRAKVGRVAWFRGQNRGRRKRVGGRLTRVCALMFYWTSQEWMSDGDRKKEIRASGDNVL